MKTKPLISFRAGKQETQADDFFSSFFADLKNNLYYRYPVQLCPAKAEIVKQDKPANAVYLIESGLVKLLRQTPNGNKVIIGLRHRDWLIGAPTVLLDRPYNFTAIAVIPSLLRGIPRKDFLDHIKKNEQFSWHVHQLLSRQILDQMKKIEAISFLLAEERLMRLLADTVREMETAVSGTPDNFTLPITNQELAQLLMITPEHLCRVLKGIEQKGLIKHDKGALVVIDPAGLLQAAAT
jgi:CRP/FNR family transcriptional regulator